MSEKPASTNPLEQFVLLAKTAKGVAAVTLIKQALEAPGVYVFSELLDMAGIQELASGQHAPYFNLLNLFAFGTFTDYNAQKAELPELTPAMLNKLRQLTMVSLATKNKCIAYSVLLTELDIPNLRTLEVRNAHERQLSVANERLLVHCKELSVLPAVDLIIEVIYADIIRGKLDQKNQQFEVDYAIGRDIRKEAVSEILTVLQDWCTGCEAVLQGIETQVRKANENKEKNIKMKKDIEQEVTNIKKTLKTTHPGDDEQMVTDSVSMTSDKPTKKASKTKGLRGSSGTKLWK